MPLTIVRNDIVKMNVDAIVNSTSESLQPGGYGVDRSIHAAAGKGLAEELAMQGSCKVGHAVLTGSHDIENCRYIIHAVAPVYRDGISGEKELLESCYDSVMKIAAGTGCRSVAIPLLAAGLIFIATRAMPRFRAVFKKYDNVNNSVQENIKGMRVVKSFVREDYEKEKFGASSEELRHDFTVCERILAFNAPLMQTAMYTSMLLISFFCAKIVVSSVGVKLGVGTLSSMITYSMQVLISLMMLSMIFVMITMSVASAKRIIEVLDEETDIKEIAQPVTEASDGSVAGGNCRYSRYILARGDGA